MSLFGKLKGEIAAKVLENQIKAFLHKMKAGTMDFKPIARVVLRYGAGILVGAGLPEAAGTYIATDPTVLTGVSWAIGAGIAWFTERSWFKNGLKG